MEEDEQLPQEFEVPNPVEIQEPSQEVFRDPIREAFQEPSQETFRDPIREAFQEPSQETFRDPIREAFQEPFQESFHKPVQDPIQEPNQEPDDLSEEREEGTYYVERVLDSRRRGGRDEYYVKWEGFSDSENTWEPIENLSGATDAIADFRSRRMIRKFRPFPSEDSDAEAEAESAVNDAGKSESDGTYQPVPEPVRDSPKTRHQYQADIDQVIRQSLREVGGDVDPPNRFSSSNRSDKAKKDFSVTKRDKRRKEKIAKKEEGKVKGRRAAERVLQARVLGDGVVLDVKFSVGPNETMRKEVLMRKYPRVWCDFVLALMHWDDDPDSE
jgi:hypothetical protein